ncbi:MAG: ATP-grasp domain-containing protein [Muribaculaceae bacterium]
MNILVTAIGSMSADCVITSLKKFADKVIGCDIYPSVWHAESKLCDKCYQAPFASSENEYINFLIAICKEHNIEFLIPLTDLEIDVIDHYRAKFQDIHVTLCMPTHEVLSVARNKYKLSELFKDDTEVPSVPTYLGDSDNLSTLSFPCIAKPYNGRSSEGLMRINSVEELNIVRGNKNYILQEYKEGHIFTVDYVRCAATNHAFCVAREELLRTKNGAGLTVKIIDDPSLRRLVSYIGQKLHINGCINMEFIKNNGDYYLIDINPRFSAGVAFTILVGYNMVVNHMNCFMNKDIDSQIELAEQILVKRYKEEII